MNLRLGRGQAAAVLLAQLVLAGGCLNHPRNNQVQASKSTQVAFDGYYLDPGQVIGIYIQNNVTGLFEAIPHAPIFSAAASAGVKDNSGSLWYPFAANDVTLPTGSQYWSAGPSGSSVNVAHLKAIGANPPDQPIELTTFDVTADDCINSAVATSGISVVQNCKSSTSPVVTLNATCGAAGGDCCIGSPPCAYGENCTNATCTVACGATSASCCRAFPFCNSAAVCSGQTTASAGQCVKCGDTGEKCCTSGCNANNTCVGGTCECGGLNQPCCAVTGCTEAGTVCDAGSHHCTKCGAVGSECCADGKCDVGSCVPSTPQQCACGGLNQGCCSGSSCALSTGYSCQNGLCAPPAKAPQCVAAGGACGMTQGLAGTPAYCCANSGLICNFNKCTSCVAHGTRCAHNTTDICCTPGELCVLDPSDTTGSSATICGQPDGVIKSGG